MVYNPFGMGNLRTGLNQQQQQQQPYNFQGLEDRLGKLETGIAGLTDQFKNFQVPGQTNIQNAETEYQGNTAASPLEGQAVSGGLESLPAPQNAEFNFDPSGGSLFDQLSTAYGQPSTSQALFNQENPNYVSQSGGPHYLRGGGNYTQGFQDFVHDQGYYVDPRGSWVDGPMSISETPIDLPGKMGGTMQQSQQGQGMWDAGIPQQAYQQLGIGSLQDPAQQKIKQGYNV